MDMDSAAPGSAAITAAVGNPDPAITAAVGNQAEAAMSGAKKKKIKNKT